MDLITVLISYLITNAIGAGVIWALYSQNRKHFNGLEFWLMAYLMQFAGLILVYTRAYLPELISVVAGNGLFIGGTILLYIGLERFLGKRSNQVYNYILLTLFVAAHVYFLIVHPSMTMRSINFSLMLVVLCAQFVWLIFRRADLKLRPIVREAGFIFAAYGIVSFIRICVNLVMPLNEDFFQINWFNTIVIMAYQMLFIALTFSLFLSVNSRLVLELHEDLNERQHMSKVINQSEQLYHQMFIEHSTVKLLVEPKTGAIVQANPAAATFYGYSIKTLEAMNIDQINVLPREDIREAMTHAIQRSRNVFSFQHRLASGEVRNVEVHSTPILVGGRELLYSIIHDITERKQAEAALSASEAKYRFLYETMAQGIVYQDGQGKILSANPAAERILGLTLDQMQGRTSIDPRWRSINENGSDFPGEKHPAMVALREGRHVSNVVMGVFNPETNEYRWININAIPQFRDGEYAPYQVYTTFDDITERKQAETALRESRETLAHFINQSPIYTYIKEVTPTQSRVIYASENFADIIGIPGSEMIGRTMEELFSAEFAAKITADDWAVASGKEILNQEEELNGHQYITIKFPLLRTGRINLLAGYTIDITERKQAEEALRASEERFRQLITSAPDVVFVVDEEGKIKFANMEATNLLGYAPDEFIGMAVEKLMPQNIREGHIANRTKYMRDPHTRLMGAQLNLLATHKDGNEIPVDIKISPVNIDGKTHIVAFMRDITMRRQAEEKLRESEEKYRLIVETAHEGIWVLDTDEKTSYVNTRMAEMLGYKIEEMIGHSLFEFMDDDARKEAEQMLERRRKGVAEQHEFRFRRKDGSPIWALLSTNAIIDSDGKFIGALGMVTDVTERKQAEEKMIKAKEEAEEGEARFRKSLEFSPTPIALADYTGKMIFLNQNFIDTYGYTLQDIPTIDQWMLQAYPDTEYRNSYLQLWEQDSDYAIKNNTATPLRECLVTCKSGEVKTVAILAFFERDLIIGHFLDISERKQAEEALRLEQAFVNNALDNQQDTFFLFDFTSGKALRWNRAFREISGYSDEEIATLPAPISYYSADDLTRENAVIQRVMQGEPASIVMNLICKDGHKIATEYQAAPLKDENGEYRYIIAIGRDITERVRIESDLRTSNEILKTQFNEINTLKETLQEQAIRDPLTGLHNRRYLDETLEHEVARAKRENYPIGIILIDIDHFKTFNDAYGHSTGDQVLKSLSRLLVESIRQGDIACRYGGEEFLVIMIGAYETDVERRAEKIRHDFNELQIRFENREISATVSIGIAYYPRHGTEIQQVIENADAAMYQAKQNGRNKVHVMGNK